MEELISVIVPVYNVQEYVGECIDSIVGQTYKLLEIILVDDGSTDESGRICDEFAQKYKCIRVIHKENEGLAKARNTGLDAANGAYISFIDSDDFIHPEFYSYMHAILNRTGADVAISPERVVKIGEEISIGMAEGKDEIIVEKQEQLLMHFTDTVYNTVGYATNKLYRRDLIGNIRFMPGNIIEDYPFCAEIALKVNTAVWTKKYFYYYRMREDSITAAGKGNIYVKYVAQLCYVMDLFDEHTNEEFSKYYTTYAINRIAFSLARANFCGKRKEVRQLHALFKREYDRRKERVEDKKSQV